MTSFISLPWLATGSVYYLAEHQGGNGGDAGGWNLNHPINKLIKFQQLLLLGSGVGRASAADGSSDASSSSSSAAAAAGGSASPPLIATAVTAASWRVAGLSLLKPAGVSAVRPAAGAARRPPRGDGRTVASSVPTAVRLRRAPGKLKSIIIVY